MLNCVTKLQNIIVTRIIFRAKLLHLQKKRPKEPISMSSATLIITLVASVILLLVAVVILGMKALFVKGGHFPSPHAHDNKALRDKGVTCHRDSD